LQTADTRKSEITLAATEYSARPALAERSAASQVQGKLALPVLLYLVALLLPIGFYVGPLYMNLVRSVLLIMFIPVTLKLFTGQYGRILVPDIIFFLLVPWIALTTSINDPGRVLEHVGSTTMELTGSYILARAYIRTAPDFIALSRAIMLMIIVTFPFALYELFTNDPLILQILQKIPGIRTEWVIRGEDEVRMGLFRVQAVFAHPIHYGMFSSIGFALCFVGLKDIYSTPRRYITMAVIIFCTFSSLSSGALLPIILQGGLIAWAYIFDKVEKRWFILIGLTFLAYILVSLISNRPPLIVFASYMAFSTWNAYWRALIFEYGMQNVWANPWIGIGLTGDWVRPEWMGPSTVDNFWLVVAMRYGFPGILLLLVGYLQPLFPIGLRKFARGTVVWRLRRAWLIIFVGLTLSLTTVHVWSALFSFVFFMFGAGMWFLTAQTEPEIAASGTADGPGVRRHLSSGLRRDPLRSPSSGPSSGPPVPDDPRAGGGYTRFPPKVRGSVPRSR
jgi:hypothetical protein